MPFRRPLKGAHRRPEIGFVAGQCLGKFAIRHTFTHIIAYRSALIRSGQVPAMLDATTLGPQHAYVQCYPLDGHICWNHASHHWQAALHIHIVRSS
jgi:hypothetical protein